MRHQLFVTAYAILISAVQAGIVLADPPAASQPASQPDVAERVKLLKAHAEELVFSFTYVGNADKPFYNVTLSAPDFMLQDEPGGFSLKERITPAQAGKIVDLLAVGGEASWLAKTQDIDKRAKTELTMPNGYLLRVDGFGKDRVLVGGLGFDLKMLRQLDAIRAVLDGDAAKAMDTLLGRMSGHRRQWEAGD